MSDVHYVGVVNDASIYGEGKRYFYALYRDDVGNLFYWKVDNLSDTASYAVNNAGLAQNDFDQFEYGVDYFDGRLAVDHSRPYTNLAFDQYRWDNQNIYYYLNSNGEFVARINQVYTYPAGIQLS
jgi:hypothetical protein